MLNRIWPNCGRIGSCGLLLAFIAATTSACTSVGYRVLEPKFDTYKRILNGSPAWSSALFSEGSSIWQSPLIGGVHAPPKLTPEEISRLARAGFGTYVSRYSSPGLWDLLRQVDPSSHLLVPENSDQEHDIQRELRPLGAQSELQAESLSLAIADANQNPLPDYLAKLPVTRAYVVALAAAYCNAGRTAALKAYAAAGGQRADGVVPPIYDASESGSLTRALKIADFKDFGLNVIRANQELTTSSIHSGLLVVELIGPPHGPGLSFVSIFAQYFSAYYKGNFVDRDGGVLSKPSLGTSISDATLSDAATVAMEAIFDFAVVNGAAAGNDAVAIKAPILFDDSSGTAKWETAKGAEPTLVTVVERLLDNTGSAISVTREGRAVATKMYTTFTVELQGSPTGGTFTIRVGKSSTDRISFAATAKDVQKAILKIQDSVVNGASVTGVAGGPYTIVLPHGLAVTMAADGSGLTGGSYIYDVALLGGPTGGSFQLQVRGNTTPKIPFNASGVQFAAALRAVEPIGDPVPTVTSQSGGSYRITLPLANTLSANADDASGLTGGKLIEPQKYVVERISKDGQQGISPAKLKIIQYVEGAANDGAKSVSGLMMRTFGGVHIGFSAGLGLLGKVSVGDNDALAKLLEAVAGTIAGRTSEFFASQALYDLGEQRPSFAIETGRPSGAFAPEAGSEEATLVPNR